MARDVGRLTWKNGPGDRNGRMSWWTIHGVMVAVFGYLSKRRGKRPHGDVYLGNSVVGAFLKQTGKGNMARWATSCGQMKLWCGCQESR